MKVALTDWTSTAPQLALQKRRRPWTDVVTQHVGLLQDGRAEEVPQEVSTGGTKEQGFFIHPLPSPFSLSHSPPELSMGAQILCSPRETASPTPCGDFSPKSRSGAHPMQETRERHIKKTGEGMQDLCPPGMIYTAQLQFLIASLILFNVVSFKQ